MSAISVPCARRTSARATISPPLRTGAVPTGAKLFHQCSACGVTTRTSGILAPSTRTKTASIDESPAPVVARRHDVAQAHRKTVQPWIARKRLAAGSQSGVGGVVAGEPRELPRLAVALRDERPQPSRTGIERQRRLDRGSEDDTAVEHLARRRESEDQR